MKHRLSLVVMLALLAPVAALAQNCETLQTITTDGTGGPDRKRAGGTYVPVAIEQIAADQTLKFVPVTGPVQYVTLHSRTPGGAWSTSYQGPRTDFPGTDPVIADCRASSNCTHIIVSVNGAHERYEPVVSAAEVQLCSAGTAQEQTLILDTTWTALKSGWQIDLPAQWDRDVEDNPNGGTGMFTSPDGNVVVGVTTMLPDQMIDDSTLIETFRTSMFKSSRIAVQQSVDLAGISGTLHRYDMEIDGAPYWAIAAYLPAAPAYYIGWILLPAALVDERAEDAVSILNTLRLLDRPKAPTTQVVPLSLVMATVGDDPRTGEAVGFSKTRFAPDTPEIHVFAALVGSDRRGKVLQQLHYVQTGQVALEMALDISAVPPEQVVELRGSFSAPTNGWPRGVYRVVWVYEGEELGSQMIYVEEAE